jgi:hypothetical protein
MYEVYLNSFQYLLMSSTNHYISYTHFHLLNQYSCYLLYFILISLYYHIEMEYVSNLNQRIQIPLLMTNLILLYYFKLLIPIEV